MSATRGLLRSVEAIKQTPPGKGTPYFEYYATRVMFNMEGKAWKFWNLGPDGDGKGGIRDTLVGKQEQQGDHKGSWAGKDHDSGGRLGATSFNLLTLQVYALHPDFSRNRDDDPEPRPK